MGAGPWPWPCAGRSCCNAEAAAAADTAGRAWAAARTPMAQPWLAQRCPQQGGTAQSCCALSPGCSLQVCLLSQTQHLSCSQEAGDGDVTLLPVGTLAEPGGDQGQEWLQRPWCRFLFCKEPLARAGWWQMHCKERSRAQSQKVSPYLSPTPGRRFTPGVSPVAGWAVGE